MGSYKDLDIYKLSRRLSIEVHKMTMTLPKYEMYEQGSQVRRSSKSIKDTIVEGYGRRRYKAEFIRYLIFAQASCDECTEQLETINELYFDDIKLNGLIEEYNILGKKINNFIKYVETSWNTNQ